MWTYLLGPLLTLLPWRWRARWAAQAPVNWPVAGLVSGLAEFVASFIALCLWYFHTMQKYIGAMVDAGVNGKTGAPPDSHQIQGAALIFFVLHPLTWTLCYFCFEGAMRLLAALVAEESPGSLPLVLIERMLARARRGPQVSRLPLVRDEVTLRSAVADSGPARGGGQPSNPQRTQGQQDWDLKVASCRPKPLWKYPQAIRYEGEFFQVTGESHAEATAARPHVYLLRRSHPREVLPGLEPYDPGDVLREAEPGFFPIVGSELRKRWRIFRAPLVADEVRSTIDHDGSGMQIHSCRPKPDWVRGRLVSYCDAYYRVESSRTEDSARPFVFELKRLPAGVPSRSVHRYSPDEPLRTRS